MEKEYEQKIREYSERNRFWTDVAIKQLGYSINVFTTINISIIGYLVSVKEKYPKFDICGEFSFELFFYLLSLLLMIISVGCGFLAVLSRLFDFRITRHITNVRKKYLKDNKNKIKELKKGLLDGKFVDVSGKKFYPIFCKYFRGKEVFPEEDDFKDEQKLKEKFIELRIHSKLFGLKTWKFHRCQIISLFASIIIYSLLIF